MAWIIEKNGKYIVQERFDMPGGKRRIKSWPAGPSMDTAKAIKRKVEDRKAQKNFGLLMSDMTIAAYEESYLNRKLADKTKDLIRLAVSYLKKHLGGEKLLGSVTTQDIKDLIAAMKEGKFGREYSQNGALTIFRTLSTFFNMAVGQHISENPCKKATGWLGSEDKVGRFLTDGEVIKLWDACNANPELWDITMVFLHTGVRLGELLNMKKEDLQGSDHIIIPKTKTRKERKIPLHPTVRHIFARIESGPMFPGWSRNRLKRAFPRAVKRAKLGRVRIHDLRHTFASNYLTGGGTLADLAMILGHSRLATTFRYSQFQKDHLAERIGCVNYHLVPRLKVV